MGSKRYRNLTKNETAAASKAAAWARGCTCGAGLVVHVHRSSRPGADGGHVQVMHFADCPLLLAGTTYDLVVHPEATS